MGDPVGAARYIRQSLTPDGNRGCSSNLTPADRPEENFHPLGRAFYGFSTLVCTPALPGPGGWAWPGHLRR